MGETLNVIKSMYVSYNGTGMQMALFFAALLYLAVQKQDEDKEKRFLFLGYTAAFFLICFFPMTAKFIMQVCIGEEVYWRMFWLLPTAAVTAYAAVLMIMQLKEKKKRYLLLLVMLVVVAMTGKIVYRPSLFERKQNHYKLPQDAIDICDIIERDASANGIGHKKLITVNDLLSSIRQYDAGILMPYGYDAIKRNKTENANTNRIFQIMSSDTKDFEALAWYAAMEECNYLAYPAGEAKETLQALGYEEVGANAAYSVYRRDVEKADYDGEWMVTQYGAPDGSPLMFYTMQDNKGHLIAVDGGWTTDADYVKRVLRELGRHVNAWIITHPHRDHAGAFTEIYKNLGKLTVDEVYAVDMPSPEVCLEKSPWDETEVYEQWLALTIENLHYVHAGDTFEVEGLSFDVFNAYDSNVEKLSKDLLNDGSMMFKVTAKEESMLFCADVGRRMSDYLLETYQDALKADYIQMGHHGNGGLKSDFYEFIEAKKAFFDAPVWLMQDTSGRYSTMKNTYLMAESGASVYSFATTPNRLILK